MVEFRYIATTTTRGRPKKTKLESQKVVENKKLIKELEDLRKITKHEYEAAFFYQTLCYNAQDINNSPKLNVHNLQSMPCSTTKHTTPISQKNLDIMMEWKLLRDKLQIESPLIDKIVYAVIIEDKYKNELIKLNNVIRPELQALKKGLKIIGHHMATKNYFNL